MQLKFSTFDQNVPFVVVEPLQQLEDGGLTGAREHEEGRFLSPGYPQVDLVDNVLILRVILETEVLQNLRKLFYILYNMLD